VQFSEDELVGATVDLRRAHPDEVEQSVIETRLTNLPFEAEHGLDDARFPNRVMKSEDLSGGFVVCGRRAREGMRACRDSAD
jgi:hypothetical protein